MDFFSLLTGSENLYKYCFVGGLSLIVLCLFYPLNKRYELACKRDLHNKSIMILNLEIDELNKEYISLKNEVAPYKNIAPENISKRVKDTINRHYISLKENRKKIGLKMAEVRYDSLTIDTLKDNIADISRYESNFKVSGWIFAIVGFVGWFGLMIKKHKEDPK